MAIAGGARSRVTMASADEHLTWDAYKPVAKNKAFDSIPWAFK